MDYTEAKTAGPTSDSGEASESTGDPKAPQAAKRSVKKAGSKTARKSQKRSSRKRSTGKKAGARNAASSAQAKYPRHSVEKALRIPRAIYEQNGGNPATPAEAVRFAGGGGITGPWRVEISSAKKYGFLEETESRSLRLTDRARKAIAPQSPNDRVTAFRDGILAAPQVSDVYNFYRGESLPDDQFFVNALTDRFHIPAGKVSEFQTIFNESIRSADLLDETGERPRLLDIGRDESHRASKAQAPARAAARKGATCFVMMPFGGHLGTYYEQLFRPAIEQAGLTAVRADARFLVLVRSWIRSGAASDQRLC